MSTQDRWRVSPIFRAALLAAFLHAHVELVAVSGIASYRDFAENFLVAPPLLAAMLAYDLIVCTALFGALAAAASALRAAPGPRYQVLAAAWSLLLALELGAELGGDLERAASALLILPFLLLGATWALARLGSRPLSLAGFAAAQCSISAGHFVSSAAQADAGFAGILGNALGSAALAAAMVFAFGRLRAPKATLTSVGAAAVALWVGLWMWSDRAPLPAGLAAERPDPRPDVYVVVFDTLRADAVDLDPNGATPNFARFARTAWVAERALSPSSWTLPGHASLFTGTFPSTHGARFVPADLRGGGELAPVATRLSAANHTLAEWLSEHGWATYAVVANIGFLGQDTGISQGFERWDDRFLPAFPAPSLADRLRRLPVLDWLDAAARSATGLREQERQYRLKHYRIADDVNRAVLRMLARRDERPFLLFANYMDAHAPYVAPREWRERVGAATLREEWLDLEAGFGAVIKGDAERLGVIRDERDPTTEERAHLRAAYAAEVRYADAAFGRLLDSLAANGLLENAIVVVTSDHGEYLGEHRLLEHSAALYQEVLSVPLMIRLPGNAAAGRGAGVAQLTDVLPTLAYALGIDPPPGVEGRVLPMLSPVPSLPDSAVAEQWENPYLADLHPERFSGDRRALLQPPYKYIWHSAGGGELYDLEADPGELRDLSAEETQRAAEMERALAAWLGARSAVEGAGAAQHMTPEERARLERLGYVAPTGADPAGSERP